MYTTLDLPVMSSMVFLCSLLWALKIVLRNHGASPDGSLQSPSSGSVLRSLWIA